jgi:hypothetical protein
MTHSWRAVTEHLEAVISFRFCEFIREFKRAFLIQESFMKN